MVGRFEPGRHAGEDLDMWWRIAYRCPKIGYISAPLTVMHLEVAGQRAIKRRLSVKRGDKDRELISKHLKLAEEQDCLKAFRPYAQQLLRKSVMTSIYHGFGQEARITIAEFRQFFPWYWALGVYLLTLFPGVTAGAVQALVYIAYRLGLEKQVTRRWILTREIAEGANKQGPADSRASN